MIKKEKIDSADIARLAGVSRATVSRVINKKGVVTPETTEKVMKVIQRYAYTPNLQAQVLAGKHSNTIGLFFTTYSKDIHINFEDSHMDFIIRMVINAASINDYYVLVKTIADPNAPIAQLQIRDMFVQNRIDAGIFINFPNYCGMIEELIASGYIVGLFDHNLSGRNEPNRIIVNMNDKAIVDAVDYLASLGHKRVMCLHGDLDRQNGKQKHDAFRRGAEKHGFYSPPEWQLFTHFSGWSSREVMSRFLKKTRELPTAICCANDAIAFGVMDILKEHGIRIPQDISVTGADDIALSRFVTPALTTSRVDFYNIFHTLTKKVIDYLEKPFEKPCCTTFSSEFVARDSCCRIH